MIAKIFAVLLVLNLAGLALQARAEAPQSWNAYSTLPAGAEHLAQQTVVEEDTDCVGKAVSFLLNKYILGQASLPDGDAQPNSFAQKIRQSDYELDVAHDSVTLNLSWAF